MSPNETINYREVIDTINAQGTPEMLIWWMAHLTTFYELIHYATLNRLDILTKVVVGSLPLAVPSRFYHKNPGWSICLYSCFLQLFILYFTTDVEKTQVELL